MGMIYQDKTYFRAFGETLDSPSPAISLQDVEMMNLDLDFGLQGMMFSPIEVDVLVL